MYLIVSPYQEVLDGIATSLSVNAGLIKLTGPTGAGKTAICARLARQLSQAGHRLVYFLTPPASIDELHAGILQQLALPTSSNVTRCLAEYLLSQPAHQRKLLLLFDDAHDLGTEVFNAIGMLCNIQDEEQSLISLVVCGRESLDERVAQPEHRALAQHLRESFVLPPLSLDQLRNFYWQYWRHRGREVSMPSTQQLKVLLKHSGGLPGAVMQQLGQQEPVSSFPGSVAAREKPEKTLTATGPLSARWLVVEVVAVIALLIGAYLMHTTTPVPAENPLASSETADNGIAATAETNEPAKPDFAAPPLTPAVGVMPPATAAETPVNEVVAETPPADPVPLAITAISQAEVEALLTTWLSAWEQKNLAGYFAAYAADFAPANQSRDAWQAQRQRSINNASDISIGWRDLTVEPQGDDGALVNVWFDYASATYRDSTQKQLLLRRSDGALRITAENNLRVERR